MRLMENAHQWPARLSSGAFILHSGIGKLQADEDTAKGVHGMAVTTYPFLGRVPPETFVKALGTAEVAIGASLLMPTVPAVVAGGALTAFSAALIGLYLRTPGARKPGSLAPTSEGLALAKDSWLLGMGVSLFWDAIRSRRQRQARLALLDRFRKQ